MGKSTLQDVSVIQQQQQQQQEPSNRKGIAEQSTAGKEVRGPWRISRVLAVS